MRIGFDVTPIYATPMYASRSGVGTYATNLFEHLRQISEDEILPLAHGMSPAGALSGGDLPSPAPPDGRRFQMNKTVWMQAILPQLLKRLHIDVCHFTNGVASLWTPCPSVVTIHDMTLWLFPEHHYRRRLLAMRPLIPVAVKRAAAVIAVSHATKADLVRILGVPEHRVHVIHEAPSPDFRPLPPGPALDAIRRKHGLPERFVLYVGTIEPRKNLGRLLEAIAHLRQTTGFRHALALVGTRGWKDDPVFATMERLQLGDVVRFLGYVPTADLVALYNLADALAFVSMYEGFGLPVVEAMACGTPVVTSPNGSLREVAGDAAEFVEPTDVQSIADGLRRVLSNPARREELRGLGLAQARHFTWEAAARQTLQLYSAAHLGISHPTGILPPTSASLPQIEPGAEALEQAVLKTVAYADVFQYPLSAHEIHRYLTEVEATPEAVRASLAGPSALGECLVEEAGWFAFKGREHLFALRRQRQGIAARLWRRARAYAFILARLPFVRMVAVTGALAMDNVSPGDDIDLMIVTAPGRLWLCRAMAIAVVRLAALLGDTLCPNYLVSEQAMQIDAHSLFAAHELVQTAPLYGERTYRRLRDLNAWTQRYLPNAAGPLIAGRCRDLGALGRLTRGLGESLLRGRLGDRLEAWEYRRKAGRLAQQATAGVGNVAFSPHVCKGHFINHGCRVTAQYEVRLAELGMIAGPVAQVEPEVRLI